MRQAFVESGGRHTRHLRTCIQHYRRGPAATLVSRLQGAPPQDPVDRSARSRQYAVQERISQLVKLGCISQDCVHSWTRDPIVCVPHKCLPVIGLRPAQFRTAQTWPFRSRLCTALKRLFYRPHIAEGWKGSPVGEPFCASHSKINIGLAMTRVTWISNGKSRADN